MVIKKVAKKAIKRVLNKSKRVTSRGISKSKLQKRRLDRKQIDKIKKQDKKINRVERILVADKAPGVDGHSKRISWNKARKDAGYVGPRSKASKAPWMKDRKDLINYLDKAEKTAPGGGPPPWVKYKEVKRGERMIDGITFRQTLDDVLTPQEMGKRIARSRTLPIKPSITTNFIRGATVGGGAVGTAWYAYDELQKEKRRKGK